MTGTSSTPAVVLRNVGAVQQRIAEAAARAGRQADDIRLIAVTKYVGLPEVEALVAAGCRDLGESRPQELWEKAAELTALTPAPSQREAERESITWHLVGHLQRNK